MTTSRDGKWRNGEGRERRDLGLGSLERERVDREGVGLEEERGRELGVRERKWRDVAEEDIVAASWCGERERERIRFWKWGEVRRERCGEEGKKAMGVWDIYWGKSIRGVDIG